MADISKIKGTDNTEYNIKDAYIRKPDGTNNLIDNNKLNLKYFPDIILGQLIYGGVVTGAGVATLSTNAKTKLGTTSTSITLTNNTAATTGYVANEGIFYVASSSGSFASLGLKTGDWLISTGAAWAKVDNTDEVTSVNNKTGAVSLTYSDVGAASSDHTHNITLAAGGTSTINLSANTTYTLTAGGKSVAFKTPADTTYSSGTGLTLSNKQFSISSANVSTILNLLTEGSSDPGDNDWYISQYANGGSSTTTFHRRPVSKLYNYMKGKMDSVYLGISAKAADSSKLNGQAASYYATSSHSHGNILSGGTITSTAVTSATGVLVYDSNNKIQRATAASTRSIIGAAALTDANQTITMSAAIVSYIKADYDYNGISLTSDEDWFKIKYGGANSSAHIEFDTEGAPMAIIGTDGDNVNWKSELIISGDGYITLSATHKGYDTVGIDINNSTPNDYHIYAYYYDIASGTRTKQVDLLNLDAGDIVSGTFATARIPGLAASKITSGTFDAARIPNLSATKITSGTLPNARLSFYWDSSVTYERGALVYYSNNWWVLNADSSKNSAPGPLSLVWQWLISGTSHQLYNSLIPDLSASKITSGTFAVARIPSLSADKITSGTFAAARLDIAKNLNLWTIGTLISYYSGDWYWLGLGSYQKVEASTQYTISIDTSHSILIEYYNSSYTYISDSGQTSSATTYTFTTPSSCSYIKIRYVRNNVSIQTVMLNKGSSALPYVPCLLNNIAPTAFQGQYVFGILNSQYSNCELSFYGSIIKSTTAKCVFIKGTLILRSAGSDLSNAYYFNPNALLSEVGLNINNIPLTADTCLGSCEFRVYDSSINAYKLRTTEHTNGYQGEVWLGAGTKGIFLERLYDISNGNHGAWSWGSIGTSNPVYIDIIIPYVE